MLLNATSKNQWAWIIVLGFFMLSAAPIQAAEVTHDVNPMKPEKAIQEPASEALLASQNPSQSSTDFLIPDSPLSPVNVEPEKTEPEFSKEADVFEDLTFHPRLIQRAKIQLSQHEAITFESQKIVAESFGNQVVLNLRDQNLTSQTFAGYVLGPFNPRNDYMNVYDDTLGSIEKLIEQALEREEKNAAPSPELAGSLKQAHETFVEFQRRTRMLKAKADEEHESMKIIEALRDHYEGELPDYDDLKVTSEKDRRGDEIKKVVMTLPHSDQGSGTQEKIFSLKLVKEDYQVLEAVEHNAEKKVLLSERYNYDAERQLRRIESTAYYLNGKVKADREERYDSGIQQSRYREEFNPEGKKTRLIREIFDESGKLKSTTDFDYLNGQKHSYLFSPEGQALSSNIEPIQ